MWEPQKSCVRNNDYHCVVAAAAAVGMADIEVVVAAAGAAVRVSSSDERLLLYFHLRLRPTAMRPRLPRPNFSIGRSPFEWQQRFLFRFRPAHVP